MPTDPTTVASEMYGDTPSDYNDPGRGVDPALDAFAEFEDLPEPVDPRALAQHHVTAVLVAHDGARWLPDALAALTEARHGPDRIVAVDTGSRDESEKMLTAALGGPSVTTMPKRTGFGAAVQAGIDHADSNAPIPSGWSRRTEWIWLLHDDCAPAPDALQRLLECAVRRPDATVIGPKVISWRDDRRLLEVGVSMTGGGRRHTGLEKLEYDQGQHDATRDVLAVGSAGMLVRRDVWEELGGFDRHLAMFRDDVDFGWRANLAGHAVLVCPDAVVRHAEAAAHGRRRLGATRDRAHLVDRRNALYVLLANAPARRWPLTLLRAVLGGVARAVGFLLGKQPALAFEELGAVLAVLGRPDRLIRARIARSRTRKVSQAELREHFPTFNQQVRNAAETVMGLVTGTGGGHDLPSRRRAATDPASEDDEPESDDAWWLKALARPPVVLGIGATLLALVASWRLIGAGQLSGGALFPAPGSTAELWSVYVEAWHGVGVGSAAAAPPYLVVLGALSWVVRTPSLAVDLLLIGSVPLAGLAAYLLLRKVVASPWLRFWGAAVYALLPATTGAIAAGRIGTTTAAILTPLVALAVMRTLGPRATPGPFRASWSAGLLLAVVVAFVPLAWVIAVLLAIAAVAAGYRAPAVLARLIVIIGVAPIVLLPWTLDVVRAPGMLLTEAGAPGPGLSDPELVPWSVLLVNPGGPGTAPLWLFVAILLAAWAALFRPEGRGPIGVGWIIAGTGLAVGLVVSRLPVTAPSLETPVSGWPGFATVLVGGGLITAAVGAAAGLRSRLARSSFGWRQPLAVVLVAAAALTPAAAAVWWVARGADEPLDRRSPAVLPAYVVEEGERAERIRTLVLDRTADGRVTYALLRKAGPRLGDAETGPPQGYQDTLEAVVSDLVSGRGGADASALADFAARYVYVPAPADPGLVDILDTVPGLTRASAPPEAAMWQVAGDIARVRVLGGAEGTVVVASDDVRAGAAIPPDAATDDRLLVLAEHADPGWTATLAGEELFATTHEGWAQAWELPATGGEVVIEHRGAERQSWLRFQLAAVLLAILLALPGMRRQRGAIGDAADDSPEDTSPRMPAVSARRRSRGAPQTPAEEARPDQYAVESVDSAAAVPASTAGTPQRSFADARLAGYNMSDHELPPPEQPLHEQPSHEVPADELPDQRLLDELLPEVTADDATAAFDAADRDSPAGGDRRTGGRRKGGGRRARRGGLADAGDVPSRESRSSGRGGRRAKGRRRRGDES